MTNDEKPPTNLDDSNDAQRLLAAIKASLSSLESLLDDPTVARAYEDGTYRFYHQSFKVYGVQAQTERIVAALQALMPERELNDWFMKIVKEGTGKRWEQAHNQRWTEETRPILEAFFHARYFLDMVVRYGKELEGTPRLIPSGWAASSICGAMSSSKATSGGG